MRMSSIGDDSTGYAELGFDKSNFPVPGIFSIGNPHDMSRGGLWLSSANDTPTKIQAFVISSMMNNMRICFAPYKPDCAG